MSARIAVVTAGLSVPSSTRLLADQLVDATEQALRARGADVTSDVIELRPLARPLADHLLTGFPGEELASAIASVRRADVLIAVTPVFQASYSGLFKTFFDVLEPGTLDAVPVLMAATAGSARHSLVLEYALRPLFAHLKAVPVPTAVFAASEDFGATTDGALDERIRRAAGELATMVAGAGAGSGAGARGSRPRGTVDDQFADPVPFEQLLGRL